MTRYTELARFRERPQSSVRAHDSERVADLPLGYSIYHRFGICVIGPMAGHEDSWRMVFWSVYDLMCHREGQGEQVVDWCPMDLIKEMARYVPDGAFVIDAKNGGWAK
jgi:hypothetical protein